jgi:N-acyl-phosphatidylethanolamine-hydrolysing phospholipase D
MEILFHWIGGATFVMTIGNINIACDPVLCERGKIQDYFWFKSKRLEEPSMTKKHLATLTFG